ncbi:MAG TPA: DUF6370 family protein [Panacibacter sp.]|nr:DUF6370 family protein [Panacibacter sp.]HNP45331.1 DUF6370 family protein [Panacibacter sp.]
MKSLISLIVYTILSLAVCAQNKGLAGKPDSSKKIIVADVACGQCRFHMKGKGCSLAIRLNGQTYFVDGTGIDSFGDAHASDGFCKAISRAEVQGEIVNNRFKATYIKLVKTSN